jgi:outer membrane protein OmpA-like peptidoglycan-associated protein
MVEVKRKPEKDITTLDATKLQLDEVIPLNNISFAPGSNAMLRKSQQGLEQLFKFLDENRNLSVELQGHICCLDPADGTDEPDGLGGNRSEGHAKNIYIYLLSKGIDRRRLKFVGLGNTKPAVYPERTEVDRELNRRPTIKITGK